MSGTALRLGAFVGVLAAVFGGAYAVGGLTEPVTAEETRRPAAHAGDAMSPGTVSPGTRSPGTMSPRTEPAGDSHGDDGHPEEAESGSTALPGLAVSDAGYTLVPRATSLPSGERVPFRFTVTGPDGHAVTSYEIQHEKELHLIVVRRDLAGFQHVHPTMAADGTWSVPLDLSAAGTYRVFADFEPAGLGRGLTLGADLAVGGRYVPERLPGPAPADMVDGYRVAMRGAPVAGEGTELTFTATRDGAPVTDLEPYLGAFGHLVSLRTGDLAYLHTHPAEEARPGDRGGPRVRFATTFPTAGRYRLFLDFRVDGQVRTAEFTVEVGGHS